MLLGHIVYKEGLLVDVEKIMLILSLTPPTNVKMLQTTLGHIGYYRKFIKGYTTITSPMEKFLKKDVAYEWTQEFQGSFDTLKAKMASMTILVFPDWDKEFHMHVNASSITLGVILAQPGEGNLDHPIAYASRKLSFAKQNYTTMEREGLVMVYALQNF